MSVYLFMYIFILIVHVGKICFLPGCRAITVFEYVLREEIFNIFNEHFASWFVTLLRRTRASFFRVKVLKLLSYLQYQMFCPADEV